MNSAAQAAAIPNRGAALDPDVVLLVRQVGGEIVDVGGVEALEAAYHEIIARGPEAGTSARLMRHAWDGLGGWTSPPPAISERKSEALPFYPRQAFSLAHNRRPLIDLLYRVGNDIVTHHGADALERVATSISRTSTLRARAIAAIWADLLPSPIAPPCPANGPSIAS